MASAEPRGILRSSSMTDMAWCSNTSDDGAMSTEGDEVRALLLTRPQTPGLGATGSQRARARPHGQPRAPRDGKRCWWRPRSQCVASGKSGWVERGVAKTLSSASPGSPRRARAPPRAAARAARRPTLFLAPPPRALWPMRPPRGGTATSLFCTPVADSLLPCRRTAPPPAPAPRAATPATRTGGASAHPACARLSGAAFRGRTRPLAESWSACAA